MGDQNDGFALFAQTVENAKELVRFRWGQHASRLVKNENIGLAVERLEDFDTLLAAHADVLNERIGVHVQFVFLLKLFQGLARLGERGPQ